MKRLIQLLLLLPLLQGCAHLLGQSSSSADRTSLWTEAHEAMARAEFAAAEARFERLRQEHPETLEGRESLFYLGSIRLDPRNSEWDTQLAEQHFQEYLGYMGEGGPRLYRYPEAQTLREIARQLNLPAESRVAALQPEERVVQVEQRVVVPARVSRELTAEVQRLRDQVAERDAKIRQQEEELERIRRTLTSPARP